MPGGVLGGTLDAGMNAAERAQGMLDKHLATGIIILLGVLLIMLTRALVKTNAARVEDVKAINAGLQRFVEENTKSNIALTRAVEAKLARGRPRAASGETPALPPPGGPPPGGPPP